MRAPGVLLSVVFASGISGFVGYTVATRELHSELATLRYEHQSARVREHELRSQLEAALTARATLEQEAQQLQTTLGERLRRLEELVAKLSPDKDPPLEHPPAENGLD